MQLGVADASLVRRYAERLPTQHEHAREIRDVYGFREFSDVRASGQWPEFLDGRAWTHAEGPLRLFEQAVAWLRRQRVLLPGVSVLVRAVAAARETAEARMHRTLGEAAASAGAGLPDRLIGLLVVPDGQRFSELERLRRAPTRSSGRAMAASLARAADVLAVGARRAQVQGVPANRLAMLARYGLTAKAPAIRELAEPRRTATLLAAARRLEAAAVDDALDLFDLLMATRLISAARRASDAERLTVMPRLERASGVVAGAAAAVFAALAAAEQTGRLDVAAVEQVAPRAQVLAAVAEVAELVPDDGAGEAAMREKLAGKYMVVRQFIEALAEVLPLHAVPAGVQVLREVRRLPELARRRVKQRPLTSGEIDEGLVSPAWRRAILHNRALPTVVDRAGYVLCVLVALHRALRRRDVYASPSMRWADPRAQLLDGPAWTGVRRDVLAGLGLDEPVDAHLAGLTTALDAAWRLLAQRLEEAGPDASVRIVPAGADGRVKLAVDRLDAVREPASLSELRTAVADMLPRVDLSSCCWKSTRGPGSSTPTPRSAR